MSRIFLSHASANNAEAIAVRDWIRTQGWDDVFLDLDPERGLVAGDRWQAALKAAVDRCELVIFIVSPEWAASTWCKAEFLLTKHGSNPKAILPVIVSPTPFSALPGEMTAEYQSVDLTAGERSVTLTVVLPPGDQTATVAFSEQGLQRLKIGIARAGIDANHFEWPPASDPHRPPYRGLKPLEGDDAGIFFGRDAAVIGALDSMRALREAAPPRLLVILGASGAGKSSFLRAGLIPRLARDDRNFHVLPVVRSERAVITGESGLLRALEGACRAAKIASTRAELRTAITGGAATLRPLLQALVEKVTPSPMDGATKPKPATLVVAIDQGEELFLAEGQDEARTFLALLRDLLIDDALAVAAVFTIRSDNYERLQLAKELDGVRQDTLSLPPMPKGAYAEVIKGPARRLEGTSRALDIDDALVQALLTDIEAGGAKDSLPLLAFTLERLYADYGAGGRLKLEHYDQLGGIAGSIEAAVEQAFKKADADPKIPGDRQARLALLRRGLIPWVAGVDPDTGAPRRRVARLSEIPAEARPLMDLLVEQRLLSTDVAGDTGEKTVEPAHEALLRRWGLLQGWLTEDAGQLSVLDGVHRASRDWAANGKSAAWLTHTTDRLRTAERLRERPDLAAYLEPTDWEYLAACAEREAAQRALRERLRRRVLWTSVGAGVIVTLAAIFIAVFVAYTKTQRLAESERNRAALRSASLAQSRVLTSLAEERFAQQDMESAAALARGALPYDSAVVPSDCDASCQSVWDADMSLLTKALGRDRLRAVLVDHIWSGGAVKDGAFSPDGKQVVTASDDRTARVFDAQTGAALTVLAGHGDRVSGAAFSPDGQSVITASDDGTARLWNARTGAPVAVLDPHSGKIRAATFAPQGKQVLVFSEGDITVWDAGSKALLWTLKASSGALSADGKWIFATAGDDKATLYDVRNRVPLSVMHGRGITVLAADVSRDGKWALTAADDGSATVWDTSSGEKVADLIGHKGNVLSASFSPDPSAQLILTTSEDRTARLWDATNGTEIKSVDAQGARFGRDGRRVVIALADGTALLLDVETREMVATFKGHEKTVNMAALSPDGQRLLTASDDRTARLWDARVDDPMLWDPAALVPADRIAFADVSATRDLAVRKESPSETGKAESREPRQIAATTACDKLGSDTGDPRKPRPAGGEPEGAPSAQAIAACRTHVEAHADEVRARHQLARALERSGAPADALKSYRDAADRGLAAAYYDMARMLWSGQGAAQDRKQALDWLERGAKANDARCHRWLAELYERGEQVPASLDQALLHHIIEADLFAKGDGELDAVVARSRRASIARNLLPQDAVNVSRRAR